MRKLSRSTNENAENALTDGLLDNGVDYTGAGADIQLQTTRFDDDSTNFEKLPKRHLYSYSIGHVFNDLCASCWFTYLLVMLRSVQKCEVLFNRMCLHAGSASY